MRRTKFLVLSLFVLITTNSYYDSAIAFGNDNKWVSGWGQGVSEAIIKKGPGNQIYVTCSKSPGLTSISFMLAGQHPKGSNITLIFDNEDAMNFSIWRDGQIPSDCNACASTYSTIHELLKSKRTVQVIFQNGLNARFSLKGSSEALGQCTPEFYR